MVACGNFYGQICRKHRDADGEEDEWRLQRQQIQCLIWKNTNVWNTGIVFLFRPCSQRAGGGWEGGWFQSKSLGCRFKIRPWHIQARVLRRTAKSMLIFPEIVFTTSSSELYSTGTANGKKASFLKPFLIINSTVWAMTEKKKISWVKCFLKKFTGWIYLKCCHIGCHQLSD